MRKVGDKKAQLKISFGMIFSILLIIIFLGFGVWAIFKFLDFGKFAQIAKFKDTLQGDVDKIWRGQQGSWSPESGYAISPGIEKVCFIDFSENRRGKDSAFYDELIFASHNPDDNLVFYPAKSANGLIFSINHLDIKKMTERDNPYCVQNVNGRVKLTVEKKYGETLVTVY